MKRTSTRRLATVAAVAVVALGAAACGSSGGGSGGGDAATSVKIGFMGDLTGPNKALGINIRNGAKLAIDEYNATSPATTIELVEYDSQGDPKQATALAPKAVEDGIVGLVGPAFSGETADTGAIWQEAGIPFVSASATRVELSDNGWTTFHRVLADDGFQGPGLATFVAKGLSAPRPSPSSTTPPSTARAWPTRLPQRSRPAGVTVAVRESVAAEGTTVPNYSSVVNTIKGANVDAVVYGGYYAQAGPFAKQLKDGGVTAAFVSGDGSLDPAFVEGAGAAAEGAYLSCTCALINAAADRDRGHLLHQLQGRVQHRPRHVLPRGLSTLPRPSSTASRAAPRQLRRSSQSSAASNFAGVSKQIQFEANGNIRVERS